MVSLAELQKGKSRLRKTVAEPVPPSLQPIVVHAAQPCSTTALENRNVDANKSLSTISSQALASAKLGLHKTPSSRLPIAKGNSPVELPTEVQDDAAELAFSKRKELFEKKRLSTTNLLPTVAEVNVGGGNDAKVFKVEIKTLRSSPRFRDALRESAGFQELNLVDHSPSIFQLFLDFCESPKDPIKYQPGRYSTEPWLTSSAAAWVLAVELGARRFEKYALAQFIQNCAIIPKGPWKYVEDHAASGSSLVTFSRHWVAWNISLSNWWSHEYIGLEAASLSEQVTPETRDPRIFDLDHWYKACGEDINALCEHNPVHREQQRLKKVKKSNPPPAEWGAEEERKATR